MKKKMKKWQRPTIITIDEKELQEIIVAGACSCFCYQAWHR